MANETDGGPAFPVEVDSKQPDGRQTGNTTWQAYGMTLRDYFAAMAMCGSLGGEPGSHLRPCTLAQESYAVADAMLAARAGASA
jgi:hypothetical protein